MRTSYRLGLMMAGVSVLSVLVFSVCEDRLNAGRAYAFAAAAAAAAIGAFFTARAVLRGLARPLDKMSSSVKSFIAADYKLDSALSKAGWPEAQGVISALNRLMLELSAYRAFHLNQVVEERAKAQALIETINDGILLVDDRGRLIYSNQLALKLLGIPMQEPDITLPGSVKQEAFASAISGIIASSENYLKVEVEVPVPGDPFQSVRGGVTPPPVVKDFRVASRQFFLATLKRPGRVIVIRDVTAEKEIESARETFFHMITHDMRAPLTSIQGYAQMMAKIMPVASEGEKLLQPILRSAQRLNGMIADILNTIKLERGEMKLHCEAVDAGALCAGVFEVHGPLAERKMIKFNLLPPPVKVEFTGDTALIDRVLANLVGNSLKFTPKGGSVTISCLASDGEALFSVEDTGPGIPKEKQQEVFEKYAQLDEHKYMGFGLGLAMCKMVVGLHKGRIWVESEEGKGSRFVFAVPLKQAGLRA